MKLSTLEDILSYQDHPLVASQLSQFIAKYKNKGVVDMDQVYELVEQTELFKYQDENHWPTLNKSELIIRLQQAVVCDIYCLDPLIPIHDLLMKHLISTLRSMHKVNLLSKKNMLELRFDYVLRMCAIVINEKKLLNQANFVNFFRYHDIFYQWFNNGSYSHSNFDYLIKPTAGPKHLLIDLTQNKLDAIFKICQQVEEKLITTESGVENIENYVAQTLKNQNSWYDKFKNKITTIRYLFEESNKNPISLPSPWWLETRKAKKELHDLLLGPHNLLTRDTKETTFKCITDYLHKRWELIVGTPLAYPYSLWLPITKICMALADAVASEINVPRYKLLMPSLDMNSFDAMECEPTSRSIESKQLQLHQFILDDKSQRPIYVLGSLESAKEDGKLKHTHIFNDQSEDLVEQEAFRIANHCQEAKKYYDIIKQLDEIRNHGGTIGSAIYRLIARLRHGGVNGDAKGKQERKGEELNSGADANEGILEFHQLLTILRPEEKSNLFSREGQGITDNFGVCWERLARPESAEFKNVQYCVELTAGLLENILNNNKDLFDLYPNNKNDLKKINLEILERDASEARSQLDRVLSQITFTPLNNYFIVKLDDNTTPGFGQAAKLLWQRLLSSEQSWETVFNHPFFIDPLPKDFKQEPNLRLMLESCPVRSLERFVRFCDEHDILSNIPYYARQMLRNPFCYQAFIEGYLSVSDFLKMNSNDLYDLKYLLNQEGLIALRLNKITVKQFLQVATASMNGSFNPRELFNSYTYTALRHNLLTMKEILDFPSHLQSALRHLATPYGLVALQKKYIRFDHCKQLSDLYKHPDDLCYFLGEILSPQGFKCLDYQIMTLDGWITAAHQNYWIREWYRAEADAKYKAIVHEKFYKVNVPIKLSILSFLSPKSKGNLAATNQRWHQLCSIACGENGDAPETMCKRRKIG